MAESVDCSEFCRLCLVKEQVNTHIFEELGELQQIHVKITACLPIKVAYEDSLPKRICDDCIYKLDQQYQFWNTTVNSEKQLKQWLSIVDEPTPKQETEKNKIKKEKEQEPTVTKTRPRRNARRKAAQNVRLAAAAAIAASDSDAGIGGDDMEIDHFAKEENDSDEDYHDNTESLEENTYTNVGLDSEEQAEAGPSGLQKSGAVASANSGSDNGGAGYLQIKIEEVDDVLWSNDGFIPDQSETDLKPKREYRKRRRKSSSESDKVYKCVKCDKEFRYKSILTRHMSTHASSGSVACDVCLKSFCDRKGLRRHQKKVHNTTHHCEICDKGFCNETNLKEHQCEKHDIKEEASESHKCHICGKILKHKYILSRHLKLHAGIYKVICDICGKTTSKSNLSNHLKLHAGIKPYKCEICQAGFVARNKLKMHMITHYKLTNTPYEEHKCHLCEKVFHHKKYLNNHLKLHTGETKVKCVICGKELNSRKSLREHLNLHNGIKPYTCTICNKSFGKLNTLRVHKFTHTSEKPHKCDEPGCGKSFIQKSNLVAHKQSHLGERPYKVGF